MDIMLYIIAGLAVVLVVAFLLIRKNKAQKPPLSTQTSLTASKAKVVEKSAPATQVDTDLSTPQTASTDDKFDSLSVAQRFVDQQRYDKAIETLKRGLIQKPNNAPLSLKLLSVYATLNQTEDFYKVYDAIKASNDEATLKQANELKTLLTEEQEQVAAQNAPKAEDAEGYASLDFDLSNESNDSTSSPSDEAAPVASDSLTDFGDVETTQQPMDDTFDLTLGDLEDSVDEFDEPTTTPVTPLDISEQDSTMSPVLDEAQTIDEADIEDFSLEFDMSKEFEGSTASPTILDADNITSEVINSDDDFVLDFSDLQTDTAPDSATSQSIDSVDDSNSDLTFSLDDADVFTDDNQAEAFTPELIEGAIAEELFVEDTFADMDSVTADSAIDTDSALTGSAPAQSDDNDNDSIDALIDDSLDFGTPSLVETASETAPTSIEVEEASTTLTPEVAAEFASRFNADFDFVKSLDSNQVTLDLAGQYLQLGEYDSAKRLLEEVITQGNSEQQNQAITLLARTA